MTTSDVPNATKGVIQRRHAAMWRDKPSFTKRLEEAEPAEAQNAASTAPKADPPTASDNPNDAKKH